ncbi:MAG: undecaprenyldiphospho-muramoylpentapeptide beta-N-acetylglucosaminyltransferase [Bacteroidia bacterium]|nr:undecaprenyldiphospho-muramoylpentapeptide beta-N-acetylglucosaminyltransferase [Bacteroidia bacterium]
MNPTPRIIFSGGGTGGHIFPAISIAQSVRKLVPHAEILFVGAEGRMEMDKVPAAGFNIVGLPIVGFQRKNILKNIKLPFLLWKSIRKAHEILDTFKPHVAVGTGGYASGPLLWACRNKKIPYLIQEQNGFPGITNKLLANRAHKICTGYPGMEKFFPKEKVVFTGNPVRQDLKELDAKKNEAIEFFGLAPLKTTLLVLGGSLGAKAINENIKKIFNQLQNNGLQIIWQTGKGYLSEIKTFIQQHGSEKGIYVSDFIGRMDLAYAAADIILSRAGASTISEICLAGKCCVFIPSPNVAEDHQTKNAKALADRRAGVLIHEWEAEHKLFEEISRLAANPELRNKIAEQARLLAKPNASDDIAKIILELIP